ncbi:MAG: DNA/RNA non-specific endonuclease [Bacilli bacterium]|nr:DNA/RNA non-specific endonuclease [Bacilli bacterium]
MLLEIFCYYTGRESFFSNAFSFTEQKTYNIDMIPEYTGKGYVVINNNEPEFTENDYTTNSFEQYSNLDLLGRCGVAYANVGIDLMPDEARGSIGMVKPSGWHTVKYDNVDGKYLYNRCHLIGYQLTGENANEKNLITCTRQMNTTTMLKYENEVTNYVKKTNNHVLYRVTPIYNGNDLLARGVQMEAYSVEDKGYGVKFNVFVYNVQDGIEIDYSNGSSKLAE